VAPSLIRTEVAAALARRARFREIEPRDAETAMGLWLETLRDGVIGLVADEADLVTALGLAIELSHPLQDCLYLALAERLGAPLVTADKKFVVKAHASHALVRVL
jgi:predicted nucleic acid-binding protein